MRTQGDVTESDESLVVDLAAGRSELVIELNGRPFRADSPVALAQSLVDLQRAESDLLMSIPFDVDVEGSRVIIDQAAHWADPAVGCYLTGLEAQAAVDKAQRIIASEAAAWPRALGQSAIDQMRSWSSELDRGGPLVVSMPRTGSTLMGVLFLFCRDPASPNGYMFDRYVHEPIAPVFWRGDDLATVSRFVEPPLSPRDVVQESAYQFADPRVARWFLSRARSPVIFTMRHPQISWPSRWRAMLSQLLNEEPSHSAAGAAQKALDEDDFSDLGDFLTRSVSAADNGFYAFISLLAMCLREGIEFVIVDNTRFRQHPEATLRELCRRLGVDFDAAMTEWTDLDPVLDRVVMSDLALGDEYRWYYQQTLGSHQGIEPETRPLVPADSFPDQLRGVSDELLTIDEAVTWHQLLLARPETLP